jgi:hypothetical protein
METRRIIATSALSAKGRNRYPVRRSQPMKGLMFPAQPGRIRMLAMLFAECFSYRRAATQEGDLTQFEKLLGTQSPRNEMRTLTSLL